MFGANSFGWAYLGEGFAGDTSGPTPINDSDSFSLASGVSIAAAASASDTASAYDGPTTTNPPTFVSTTGRQTSTAITITLPSSTVVGDLVVIAMFVFGSDCPTGLSASGWTVIDDTGTSGGRQITAWRFLDGTEGSTVTFSYSHGTNFANWAHAFAYRYVNNLANPFGTPTAHVFQPSGSFTNNSSMGPITLDRDNEVAILTYWMFQGGALPDWISTNGNVRYDDHGSFAFSGIDVGLVDMNAAVEGSVESFTGTGGAGNYEYRILTLLPITVGPSKPVVQLSALETATLTDASGGIATSTPTAKTSSDSGAATDAVGTAITDFDVIHLSETNSVATLTDTVKSDSDTGTLSSTGATTTATNVASSDSGALSSTAVVTVVPPVDLNDQDAAALGELYSLLVAVASSDSAALTQNDGGSPGGGTPPPTDGGGTGSPGVTTRLSRRSLASVA